MNQFDPCMVNKRHCWYSLLGWCSWRTLSDAMLQIAIMLRAVWVVHEKLTGLKRRAQRKLLRGSARRVNMKMEELVQDGLGEISKLGVNVGRELR